MFELFIALGAGLISFLSPCVLPLIPGYISYISGSSLNELIEKKNINLIPIILFTVGFSIVFIIFGAASTFFGSIVTSKFFRIKNTSRSYYYYFFTPYNRCNKFKVFEL